MIFWAWKLCPSVFRVQNFVAMYMVCQNNQRLTPLFLSSGARDPIAAQYRLCLVMFNLDDSWNKNHNSEPWNKDGFLLSTSSITVHRSELRKIAQTFK